MKNYKLLVSVIIGIFILLWCGTNIIIFSGSTNSERPYMVEISRAAAKIGEGEDIDKCVNESIYIKKIILCDSEEKITENSHYDYCLKKVGDNLYRFEYEVSDAENSGIIIALNLIFLILFIFVVSVLFYIYKKIIRPFSELESVPYELSKGNLTVALPEEKEKYFGKFVWGTNLLRENIEERREKELNLHREKKLLLLSLTHDIKTPLSVIKLNTQALERGLYKEEERKKEALAAIRSKVDEIEGYVSEITKASKEDFLDLAVSEEEFYLSNVVDKITDYYKDKLALLKTDFNVEKYKNCLLSGDENRLIEVLQNLMENAIKYGDGKEINISFDEEEGCRLITVENSGKGLSSEELLKIFDSFYRGSNVSNQNGSGLGLYICRQLMNAMNGDIFVKQDDTHFKMTVVVRMCG